MLSGETTMKRRATVIAAVALIGAPAFAADLGRPMYKAPAPVAPAYDWTGFYVGLNAGGVFGGDSNVALPSADFGPFPSGFAAAQSIGAFPTSLNVRQAGFIGGGQIGYNWQFNRFVAGFETDIQGASAKGSSTASLFNPAPPAINFTAPVGGTATVSRRLDYLGTVRVRLGYAADNVLFYVTGGLAYGETELSYAGTIGFPIAPTVVLAAANSTSKTSAGGAIGGGMEYGFGRNWSAKVEYLYFDLGHQPTTIGGAFTNFNPPTGGFSTATVHNNGNILRGGLNYRF
jgi:outer membrane immunogenic protein